MTTVAAPAARLHRSRALGTSVELLVTEPDALVAATELCRAELERIDRVASRFRPDSGVSRLRRSAGRPVAVGDELFEVVAVAVRAAALTDGAVDPTVGAALIRLGYDGDFAGTDAELPGRLPAPRPVTGWRSIELDAAAGTVRVPDGVVLDLGATAKALAADRIATTVHRRCGCGVLISLGGDLAVAGAPEEGFAVGVGEAGEPSGEGVAVAVCAGGLATSGTGVRRWRLGGLPVHHIVDPATGLPVPPVWTAVTVAAGSCVDANTASTAAMVFGAAAPRWLAARDLPARLVAADGRVVTVASWPAEPAEPGPDGPVPGLG